MKVKIEGMSCGGCSARVEKALNAVAGIESVKVDLADNSASYAGTVPEAVIKAAIEEIGYDVTGFEN